MCLFRTSSCLTYSCEKRKLQVSSKISISEGQNAGANITHLNEYLESAFLSIWCFLSRIFFFFFCLNLKGVFFLRGSTSYELLAFKRVSFLKNITHHYSSIFFFHLFSLLCYLYPTFSSPRSFRYQLLFSVLFFNQDQSQFSWGREFRRSIVLNIHCPLQFILYHK